jgi:hypothetical protein
MQIGLHILQVNSHIEHPAPKQKGKDQDRPPDKRPVREYFLCCHNMLIYLNLLERAITAFFTSKPKRHLDDFS